MQGRTRPWDGQEPGGEGGVSDRTPGGSGSYLRTGHCCTSSLLASRWLQQTSSPLAAMSHRGGPGGQGTTITARGVAAGLEAVGSHRGGRGHQDGGQWEVGSAHVGSAVVLEQPWQQGQQQSEGQEVQQEAEEDHSDHAGLGRLLADGWARGAAPASSPAHDSVARIRPGWACGGSARGHLWVAQSQTPTLPRGKLGFTAPVIISTCKQPVGTLKRGPAPPCRGPRHTTWGSQCAPFHPPTPGSRKQVARVAQGNRSKRGQPPRGAEVGASRPRAAPHPTRPPHVPMRRRQGNSADGGERDICSSGPTRGASLRPRERHPRRPRLQPALGGRGTRTGPGDPAQDPHPARPRTWHGRARDEDGSSD